MKIYRQSTIAMTCFTLSALAAAAAEGQSSYDNRATPVVQETSSQEILRNPSSNIAAPSAKSMKKCLVVLDFSQASVTPINTKVRYELKSVWKIDFSKGDVESTSFGHSIDARMPLRRYISNKSNGEETIPKVTAWATYYDHGSKTGAPELCISGNDIPDEEGGSDDMESFSLTLLLSFTDQTHAVANGSIQVNITDYGNYKAKLDNVRVTIQK